MVESLGSWERKGPTISDVVVIDLPCSTPHTRLDTVDLPRPTSPEPDYTDPGELVMDMDIFHP